MEVLINGNSIKYQGNIMPESELIELEGALLRVIRAEEAFFQRENKQKRQGVKKGSICGMEGLTGPYIL